jgi:RHS repeat-associated protein
LREKRAGASDVTRYDWDDDGCLAQVSLPDGRRVSFTYDAFARRLTKRVAIVDATDAEIPRYVVHYVWDKTQLRHEIRFDAESGERRVRSYLHEESNDDAPFAQRDERGLRYFVCDIAGTPEELVDGAGNLVGRLTRSVFGVVQPEGETTEVRFPGQVADGETGLSYNRYRYYDPEQGRYISPDPIGLDGGLHAFTFGPNPVGWFDPLGLTHLLTVAAAGRHPDAEASYDSRIDEEAYPNNASRTTCHTERKLINDIRGPDGTGGLEGRHMRVQGQLPPCPNCHRAMQALGRDGNGGTITYRWGSPPNSITYPLGTASRPPRGSGRDLVDAYGMTERPEGDNRTDGYAFRDSAGKSTWNGAWEAYRQAQ